MQSKTLLGVLILAFIAILAGVWALRRPSDPAPSANPAPPVVAQPAITPEAPAETPPEFTQAAATPTPSGVQRKERRIEIRGTDEASIRASLENLRSDPATAGLADELEASLKAFHSMIESGMDREEAARIMEKSMKDSFMKQHGGRDEQGRERRIEVRVEEGRKN